MSRLKYLPWLLLAVAVVYILATRQPSPSPDTPPTVSEVAPSADEQLDFHIPRPTLEAANREPADALINPDISIPDKLIIMERILIDYQSTYHELPSGTTEEVYAALSGQNPRGISYISPEHPVTQTEEFFFHSLGRNAIEIRHWGTDLIHFSDDDVVSKPYSSLTPKL